MNQAKHIEAKHILVQNKSMTTHRYETRLQTALKKKIREECKRISTLLEKADNTPEITISPERFRAVATLFEELRTTTLWKSDAQFNTTVRNKISEIRNMVRMIQGKYNESLGVVVGRTLLTGYDNIFAARHMFYALEEMEKCMNA
jgi:hypothetical protein